MPDVTATVSYDFTTNVIQIPVVFDSSNEIWIPPCAVPSGTWTLTWTLVGDATFQSIEFPTTGTSLPQGVKDPTMPSEQNGLQASFQNRVTMVNSFTYTVFLQPEAGGPAVRWDPTIAVVKDPMG
jgi:hypothetical protein